MLLRKVPPQAPNLRYLGGETRRASPNIERVGALEKMRVGAAEGGGREGRRVAVCWRKPGGVRCHVRWNSYPTARTFRSDPRSLYYGCRLCSCLKRGSPQLCRKGIPPTLMRSTCRAPVAPTPVARYSTITPQYVHYTHSKVLYIRSTAQYSAVRRCGRGE